MGLQWVEQRALPWNGPSTCLSNGNDMRVGRYSLCTLHPIDEDRMIFLWAGMKQPGGLPLTFFICANWYVWVMCIRHRSTLKRKRGKLCFTYSKVCVLQNYLRCTVSRLEQDRWSGLEQRSSPLPIWNCCSSINTVQQPVCPLDWWKAPLYFTINWLVLPSIYLGKVCLGHVLLCNMSHSFSSA